MKMNLNQITLPALSIKASVAFYQRMGFNLIVLSEDYARFESSLGEATFSLHKVEECAGQESAIIYFEVASVQQTVKELEAAGFIFEQQPREQSWLWTEAYLKDPAGNRICIYHAGENRRFPPWRIN